MAERSIVINGQDPAKFTPEYISTMISVGVTASVVNLGVYNPFTVVTRTPGDTVMIAARWLRKLRDHRHRLRLATTAKDIRDAVAEGKAGLILAFQGVDPIDDAVDLVDVFHRIGVRIMQLTYNSPNRLGDGCKDPRDAGLTRDGRLFIERMNELGIVLDLSHTGLRTSLEAIDASSTPPIFSHSNARAIFPTSRNLTDEQIKNVARRGGVIGISMYPGVLAQGRPATLDDPAQHARYLADLVGPEHVGLGVDMGEDYTADDFARLYRELDIAVPTAGLVPENLKGISQLPELYAALERHGFNKQELAGIMGLNFLRVFEHIWGE